MQTTIRILALLGALALTGGAQTLLHEFPGTGTGDRMGTAADTGRVTVVSPFGGCGFAPAWFVGAPGWSGGRGRVELWYEDLTFTWVHQASIEGTAAGDAFGAALDLGGDLNDDGDRDRVFGAPGANGDKGYVRCMHSQNVTVPITICGWGDAWTVHGSASGDRFGEALAIVGDVNADGADDVLVGAPGRNTLNPATLQPRPDAGETRVLSGIDGSVLRTHSGTQTDAHLGAAVAALGDVDGDGVRDYAVGEPGRDAGALTDCGAVRAFSGATGAPLAALTATGTFNGARMGAALAGAGDVDGDGTDDLLVGFPSYTTGTFPFSILSRGRAELRSGASGAVLFWVQGGGPFARCGAALAGGGDLDDDGVPDLVIGHPGDQGGDGRATVHSGRTFTEMYDIGGQFGEELGAFVGIRPSAFGGGEIIAGSPGRSSDRGALSVWSGLVDWTLPGGFGRWGSSLAVVPDTDGDGWDDLVVGRYGPLAFHVTSSWHLLSGRTSAQLFGWSSNAADEGHTLSGLRDVDGDGRGDLVVGNPAYGWVEVRSGATPSQVLWTASGPTNTLFGHAVADAGDVDGDGVPDVIAGDPWSDAGPGTDAGRIVLLSGATGTVIRAHDGAFAGEELGWAVTGLGDWDGDGRDDYAAGAPKRSYGAGESGEVRIWSGLSGALLFTVPGDPTQSAHLGQALCGPGDVDGDGYADLAAAEPDWSSVSLAGAGAVRVIAGGPAAGPHPLLHLLQGTAAGEHVGRALCPTGDVDRDGRPDLALSATDTLPGPAVRVLSGAGGTTVWDDHEPPSPTTGCPGDTGFALSGLRDPHADGRNEVLIGSPGGSALTSCVALAELPRASAESQGFGCGNPGTNLDQPRMTLDEPRLGRLLTLSVTQFPWTVPQAEVFLSADQGTPALLGSGCALFLDLPTTFPFLSLPLVMGDGEITFVYPDDPAFAGLQLRAQGAALHPPAPLGFVLTQGYVLATGF